MYCPDCGPANVHLGDEFARIQSDLVGKMESSQFPLIAARLLLADNLTDHRLLVKIRAAGSEERVAGSDRLRLENRPPSRSSDSLTSVNYQLCWCEPKRLRRFFNTSSTRKRVNFETPMIHSLARRVGIVAPFRGLPRTTGSAGSK